MPPGKGKKRRKSVHSPRGRRKSYKNGMSAGAYKAIRIILPVLMALVLGAGVAIPLSLYFKENSPSPHGSTREQAEEYFTPEQRQELLSPVNRASPLEETYVPELSEVEGVSVNVLAEKPLENMLAKAREDSVNLQVRAGYISYEEQNALYENAFNALKEQKGVTSVKAEAQTVKTVPKAGQSEAQTGLLAVFSDGDEADFAKSRSFSWLNDNAADYGFVLRYPQDKEDVTSMSYNPSAYRYTGQENALQMRILNMCLEEFAEYNAMK